MNESISQSMVPVVSALVRTEDILGAHRVWAAENKTQKTFLELFFDRWRKQAKSMREVESIFSFRASVINKFLKSRGFSIYLNPFGPREFGVAAVFRLLVEWAIMGEETLIRGKDTNEYPAVSMTELAVQYFSVPSAMHKHPVVRVRVHGNDTVYMTILEGSVTSPFGLISRAHQLRHALKENHEFGRFNFPMVDYSQEVDLDWLREMHTTTASGQQAWISQAKQQNKLKLNPYGALMESAAALGVKGESAIVAKPAYTINAPFLFWCERPGFGYPIFAARIGYKDWKNPGKIHGSETPREEEDDIE